MVHELLIEVASLVVEHGLSSCDTWVYFLCGVWDLPRPGLKPVSTALAGRFLTTAPPGKSRTPGTAGKQMRGNLQDGGGVRRGDHLPLHKYIKITSNCGTAPTEHLLNAGFPKQRIGANQHSPAREACLLTCWGGRGLGAEARALEVRSQGEDWGWLREHSLKGASAPQLARRESGKNSGPAEEARDHCFRVCEERGILPRLPTEGRAQPK